MPVGASLVYSYVHPEGIVLTDEGVATLGIPIEDE